MNISKHIKRYMKKEYGPRKKQLPESLKFLSTSGVNFHAITEDESTGRIIRTIEIKPRTLKRIVEDFESLYDSLINNNEIVKQLKSDIKKLHSENKKLKNNQEAYLNTEIKMNEAKNKISALTKEIKSAKLVNSEISEKESEIESLKNQVSEYKKELNSLKVETIGFKNEIEDLRVKLDEKADKLEKIEQVNATLMKNIEESPEKHVKRNRNGFFSSEKTNTIVNNKPYPGGKGKKDK